MDCSLCWWWWRWRSERLDGVTWRARTVIDSSRLTTVSSSTSDWEPNESSNCWKDDATSRSVSSTTSDDVPPSCDHDAAAPATGTPAAGGSDDSATCWTYWWWIWTADACSIAGFWSCIRTGLDAIIGTPFPYAHIIRLSRIPRSLRRNNAKNDRVLHQIRPTHYIDKLPYNLKPTATLWNLSFIVNLCVQLSS